MKNQKLFISRLKMTVLLLAVYFFIAQVPIAFVTDNAGTQSTAFSTIASINGAAQGGLKFFSLGLMPYFMATLTIKVLTQGISPSLAELSRGSQEQRKQFEKISKIIFYVIAMTQSVGYFLMQNGQAFSLRVMLAPGAIPAILALFVGAVLSRFIAEQITKHGLTNGYVLVIALMLGSSILNGIIDIAVSSSNFKILAMNIGLLLGLLTISILLQRIRFKLPVAIDQVTSVAGKAKTTSLTFDNFNISMMCVGVTPIVYFSFVSPVLSLIGVENKVTILLVSMALIYVFTDMSVKSDYNVTQLTDALLFKGIHLRRNDASINATKSEIKSLFERIIVLNTLILFAYYSTNLLIGQVEVLNGIAKSGINGIQILMMGYVLLDIFYTVKAYFVKTAPELIY